MELPNVARMYDYYLGGTEANDTDREAAQRVLDNSPQVSVAVRENRGFLERAVHFLVAQGITQFLDLGSGLPTQRNVHQILTEYGHGGRVVYVDYDPYVVSRSADLLASVENAICLQGDVRELPLLFTNPDLLRLIDFARPLGVLMLAVLNFVPDEDDPAGILTTLRGHTAPGSFLALSHGAREDSTDGIESAYRRASGQASLRTRSELGNLLSPFTLVPPGIVYSAQWHVDGRPVDDPGTRMLFSAVARL